MPTRNRRMLLAAALSAAVVVSIAAGAILLVQRASAQISVTDVGLVSDSPASGMTEVRARLVLQNAGRSVVHFELLTLFAYDPVNETLFDTFSHTNVQINPGETQAFSEDHKSHRSLVRSRFHPEGFSKWSAQLGAISRPESARDLDRLVARSLVRVRCDGR